MNAIRSLLFNTLFLTATLGLGVLLLPFLLGPYTWAQAAGRIWAGCCMALLKAVVGLEWEVRGAPPKGAALIVAKHQSAWETLAFALILRDPAFVMKQSLLWTPPFGVYLWRAGMIPIDRSSGSKAIRKMLDRARAALNQDRPVVIFPEGTRRDPHAPPAYLPGVAALYRGLDAPCVPAALNSGVFWGRHAFAKRPGRITVAFLEPIPPGLVRSRFLAVLEDEIETATASLVEEAEQAVGIAVR